MSADYGIMFNPEGKPTALLVSRWHAKGSLRGLQPSAVYVSGGYANPAFRGLWRTAFPTRDPIPTDRIVLADGRFTQAMLSVWV